MCRNSGPVVEWKFLANSFYIPVPSCKFFPILSIKVLTGLLVPCDNPGSLSRRESKAATRFHAVLGDDGEFDASYNRTLPQAFIAHPSGR
jgi:hypothetical protein